MLHIANVQRASGSLRACIVDRQSTCTCSHRRRVGVWGYSGWWLRSQPEAGMVTGIEVGGVVIACAHSTSVSPWVRIAPGVRSCLLWCEMIAFLRSKAHKKSQFLLSHGVWGISKQALHPAVITRVQKARCSYSKCICIYRGEQEHSWLQLRVMPDKRLWSKHGGENETHLKGFSSKATSGKEIALRCQPKEENNTDWVHQNGAEMQKHNAKPPHGQ